MARNIFAGKTQAWLLEKRDAVLEAYTSTVTSAAGGDSSATNQSLQNLETMLQQIDYALFLIDPANHPESNLASNRTKADFS